MNVFFNVVFRDSKLIIDGYLECLSSSDPEIVMSAAKVLSEIAILAAGLNFKSYLTGPLERTL